MKPFATPLRHRVSSFLYRYGWDTRCRNRCPAKLLSSRLAQPGSPSRLDLLDVGCGRLGVAAFLPNTVIVGSDILPPTETARHFTFVSSDATALPFCDRAFLAVSCVDVLEHLPPEARVQVIRECVRVASRLVLIAFPSGETARRCDVEYRQACEQRHRAIPAWVAEHLRYEYPVADAVAFQVQMAARAAGHAVRIWRSQCEPLAICRLVRAAAARSTALYAMANILFGILSPLILRPDATHSYRTILVAELSPLEAA